MGNTVFHFKQFSVVQERSAMKVGTDGVLLGAWAPLEGAGRILDVGTGTGLIALMLAQRQPEAYITGIDIDEASCREASDNFSASPWSSRLEAVHTSLQQFAIMTTEKFDLVVSNPPYFNRSLPSSSPGRTIARHDHTLSLEELLMCSVNILKPDGCLALILPSSQYEQFSLTAKENGLYEKKKMWVCPLPEKPSHRIMSLWSLYFPEKHAEENLTIEEKGRHLYSIAYIQLTKDFYLYMP